MFSASTQQLLENAGWTPNRNVNLDHVVSQLKAWGYEVYPPVQDFLRKFYGLKIKFPIKEDQQQYPEYLNFDPLDQGEWYAPAASPQLYSRYLQHVGEMPCVIGWFGTDAYENWFMDSKGKLYSTDVDAEFTRYIGKSGRAAIENLVQHDISDKPFLSRWLDPVNEYTLKNLFDHNPTVASVYHRNIKENSRRIIPHGYTTAHFLHDKGHNVYVVEENPNAIQDTWHGDIVRKITDVPAKIDLLIYNDAKFTDSIVEIGKSLKVNLIYLDGAGFNAEDRAKAEADGLKFMMGWRLTTLYEHLFEPIP